MTRMMKNRCFGIIPPLLLMLTFSFLWKIGFSFSTTQPLKTNSFSSPSSTTRIRIRPGNSHLFQQFGDSSFHNEDGINEGDGDGDSDDEDKWLLPTFTDNDDWRSFRAKMVLQEHYITTAKEEQTQQWAYQQPNLEKGAILVQDPFSLRADPKKEHYTSSLLDHIHWYKSVVIVLESNARETVGLVLNRPANLTLSPVEGFTSTMLYGGTQSSFHSPDDRVFCLHRNEALKDESTTVLSGLYLLSLMEAQQAIRNNRAVPADFLYISGYESFHTPTLTNDLRAGHWRSVTTDAVTLQRALAPDAWNSLLTMTGSPPPSSMQETYSTDDIIVLDALLQEWTQKCLYYWSPVTQIDDPANLIPSSPGQYPPPVPHSIQAGDLLRGSSMDHAFLFDHQEFHKSLVLVLDVVHENDRPETAIAALLSYPTVEMDATTGLPVRHGGNENCNGKNDGEDIYCLHFLGPDAVRSSHKIGSNFNRCTLNDAIDAIRDQKARHEDFLVIRGTVSFPLEDAALDVVPSDAAPAIWHNLSHQQALSPLTLEDNIQIARHAWKRAGGEEMMPSSPVNDLGKETVRAWLSSNLLVTANKYNDGYSDGNDNPNELRP